MATEQALQHTPLHQAHIDAGGKMVDFAGWHMPVQYKAGILAEHKFVREAVGLFDVSHMGEIDFEGPRAGEAVQRLVSNAVGKLVDGQALYTVTCRTHGGIVDDCIVYRHGAESFRIVVNASNIAKDEAHFREHATGICEITNRSDETALIAVQGPKARELVATLDGGARMLDIAGFRFAEGQIAGKRIVAARTGYTGEDGFELFVRADDARAVWDALLEGGAQPCGLGARDTLRLEAKLCLYGNDIDETTNPWEAGLAWVVKLDAGDFVGRDALIAAKPKSTRTLVGFKVVGKGIVRPGWEFRDEQGRGVGKVTSGGPAPTIGGSVGMGYVPLAMAEPGQQWTIHGPHDKTLAVEIVRGPFYKRPKV
ncbi:glycine cleavage system aminomethyltransferase GcvT [Nannocystaceae bacterium ST9]